MGGELGSALKNFVVKCSVSKIEEGLVNRLTLSNTVLLFLDPEQFRDQVVLFLCTYRIRKSGGANPYNVSLQGLNNYLVSSVLITPDSTSWSIQ